MSKKADRETHDRKVKEIARDLRCRGYEVKAGLPAYENPDPVGKGKRIPDIQASSWWGDKVIVEVDTPGTVDKDQLSALRRSAGQKGAEFKHVMVNPRGDKKK